MRKVDRHVEPSHLPPPRPAWRRVLLGLAALVALLPGGCDLRGDEGVRVSMILRDADTGALLDNCMLLRWKIVHEGDQVVGTMGYRDMHFEDVALEAINSGYVLEQDRLTVVFMPFVVMLHVEEEDYGYAVMKEGYGLTELTSAEILWEGRRGTPMVLDLQTSPRPWLRSELSSWMLDHLLAVLPADDPLRARLIRLAK